MVGSVSLHWSDPRAVTLSLLHKCEQLLGLVLCNNVTDICVMGCFALFLDFLLDRPVFFPIIIGLCESGLSVGSLLSSCQKTDGSITTWLAMPRGCHLGRDVGV